MAHTLNSNSVSMDPVPYTIVKRTDENHDTYTFVLKPKDGSPVPAFKHGQFNMLYLLGQGEIPISISGDADDRTGYTHTIRAVGAVTRAMHALKVGDTVGVRGPFGEPWPVPVAQKHDVCLMAGGIGLAPLRPVIYALLKNRSSFGNVDIFYGARTPVDQIFLDEITAWQQRNDINFRVTVDHAAQSWTGHVGVVTNLVKRHTFRPTQTIAMACGPEVMMKFSKDALLAAGVPGTQIYLSMERSMACGVGHCGHCQCGPFFICKDGPVMAWPRIAPYFNVREI